MSSPLSLIISESSTLQVKVIPRARRTEYVGQMSDKSLKIRVAALPEEGKANEALLFYLKEQTGISWRVIAGQKGTRKILKRISTCDEM